MPFVVALSSKAIVSSTSSNNQATEICNLLSNQGSDATLLGISTQMHLWLTDNCSGNKVISAPHHVLTKGSLLSTEGNICSSIYGGKIFYSASKTLLSLVSCDRSKFLVSTKHQQRDTRFYVENPSTWGEKPRAEATQIFFHYYQMWDTTSSSLDNTRGSHTSRFLNLGWTQQDLELKS